MAERWQQWMPFHIDKFRGSPEVQAMHPAARLGYIYLLASMWQTEDCTISADPFDLATESGLGDELWMVHGTRIMRKMENVDGRLRNEVLYVEWAATKLTWDSKHLPPDELSQLRSVAGKAGNAKRWADRKPIANPSQTPTESSQTDRKTSLTGTRTITSTEKEQKPSRGKREQRKESSLFTVFRGLVSAWWQSVDPAGEMPWDGSEAKKLSALMAANPKLGPDGMRRLLEYRARSHGVNLAERPRKWLENLTDYARGPLNQFKQPEGTHGTNRGDQPQRVSPAVQRGIESRNAIRAAGARRYGVSADGADGAGSGPVSEPAVATRDTGHVPGGVGGDDEAVWAGGVQGRVVEGDP